MPARKINPSIQCTNRKQHNIMTTTPSPNEMMKNLKSVQILVVPLSAILSAQIKPLERVGMNNM